MDIHHQDIFYDTSKMGIRMKKTILKDGKSKATAWRVDILDCSKSWQRKQIDMSFEDIMKKLDKTSHYTIIHRRGYESWKDHRIFPSDKMSISRWKLEMGFCTMGVGPDYFLWIDLDESFIPYFVKKYNLKTML